VTASNGRLSVPYLGDSSAFFNWENPTASAAYTTAYGTLFGPGGPSYLDVQQGNTGDCWLIASLAEVAARDPADVRTMFTWEGASVVNGAMVGTYAVRFYTSKAEAISETVDTELPELPSGVTVYDHPLNGVLWVRACGEGLCPGQPRPGSS
jgi:Calpain family cysteine protease